MNVPLVLLCLWLIDARRAGVPRRSQRTASTCSARALCALGWPGPCSRSSSARPRLVRSGGDGCRSSAGLARSRCSSPTSGARPTRCCRWRSSARATSPSGTSVTFAVYAGLGAATFFIALFLQQVAGYTRAWRRGFRWCRSRCCSSRCSALRRALGADRAAAADGRPGRCARRRAAAVRAPRRARRLPDRCAAVRR